MHKTDTIQMVNVGNGDSSNDGGPISDNDRNDNDETPVVDNVFEEGKRYAFHAFFIYLLSHSRKLAETGYAPFSYESVDLNKPQHCPQGFGASQIFALVLQLLRREEIRGKQQHQDHGVFQDRQDPYLFDRMEQWMEESLVDKGDPVKLCALKGGRPKQTLLDTHQHAGSCQACLCTKFGLHNMQVMVDHLIRSEEEKRQREQIAARQRPPRPNIVVDAYQEYIAPPPLPEPTAEEQSEDKTINEILSSIADASSTETVDHVKQQFKPGSIMYVALDCSARTQLIRDKHPDLECVYCISVDKEHNTVQVAFRGTFTMDDWIKNTRAKMVQRPNPIQEDYDGKQPYLCLHEGFSSFILRQSLYDGRTKYEEIADQAHALGCREIGTHKYRLVVSGHSLGGAIATIFGFYASADERFTGDSVASNPIHCFTYSAPWAGDMSFFEAFRHQELARRIRLVRFASERDIVPVCPPNVVCTSRGTNYIHVGVGISLSERDGVKPKIKYNANYDSFWAMMGMRVRNFVAWKLPLFRLKYHDPAPVFSRIEAARRALVDRMDPGGRSSTSEVLPSLKDLYEQHVY